MQISLTQEEYLFVAQVAQSLVTISEDRADMPEVDGFTPDKVIPVDVNTVGAHLAAAKAMNIFPVSVLNSLALGGMPPLKSQRGTKIAVIYRDKPMPAYTVQHDCQVAVIVTGGPIVYEVLGWTNKQGTIAQETLGSL